MTNNQHTGVITKFKSITNTTVNIRHGHNLEQIQVLERRDLTGPEADYHKDVLYYFNSVANYINDIKWNNTIEYNIKAITAKYPTLYHDLTTNTALRLFCQYCNNPITKQRVAKKLFIQSP